MMVEKLTLRSCHIKVISANAFRKFPNLRVLDLVQNELSSFMVSPNTMRNLEELNLAGNQLVVFPMETLSFPKLVTLNVIWNQIETVDTTKITDERSVSPTLKLVAAFTNPAVCDCNWVILDTILPENATLSGRCDNHTLRFSDLNVTLCGPEQVSRLSRSLTSDQLPDVIKEPELFDVSDVKLDLSEQRKQLLSLAASSINDAKENFVRSELGVGFDRFQYLYPGVENYFIHMHVSWPEINLPDANFMDDALGQICTSQDSLIKAYVNTCRRIVIGDGAWERMPFMCRGMLRICR